MAKRNGNPELSLLGKIAKALDAVPSARERCRVIEALTQEPWGDAKARAVAVQRISSLLEEQDEPTRRRALAFFADQLGGSADEATSAA